MLFCKEPNMNLPTEKISVVIPCYNEERYIGKCLDSILANDYPHHSLEIIVVDGRSDDRTRDIVHLYQEKYSFLRLLENPERFTTAALNKGIQAASGEIILRIDAHSVYPTEYISKCVKYLRQYDASNVGGVWRIRPGEETFIAKAIALALAHPFGIGLARYRTVKVSHSPQEVDTVPYGCFPKKIFEHIGYFREDLPRWKGRCNEDIDFNKRIRESGGKIFLIPEIIVYYYARGTLKSFLQHNFNNGVLVTMPLGNNDMDFSYRHLVPGFFVLSFMTLIPLSFISPFFRTLFFFPFSLYLSLSLYFSFKRMFVYKNPLYFFFMPVVFFVLHLSYGLGSLYGLLKTFRIKWQNAVKLEKPLS